VIVAEFGILPHNIELAVMPDGGIVLDYHLEFQPGISLREAEQLGHRISEAVKRELPDVQLIYSHLEEERSDRALPKLRDISDERRAWVEEITSMVTSFSAEVRNVSNIRLYESEADRAIKLMLAITMLPDIALAHAHDVSTAIEARLRKHFPDLARIVIHTHPEQSRALTPATRKCHRPDSD
jgi:divalent metal cation (Fe/Co/Zn/Cd) transporter